jgi:predicted ATPase/class 3 adenylate cyclase
MSAPLSDVTLLFTDIEGSTGWIECLGADYAAFLETHRRLLRACGAAHNGREVDATGDGMLWCFELAVDALRCAGAMQLALASANQPELEDLRVRIGVHSGAPFRNGASFVGLDVHRGARLLRAAHGGQIVFSHATMEAATRELAGKPWPDGLEIRALGRHQLRSLGEEHIFQLDVPILATDFPPLRALDLRPHHLAAPVTEILGRQREIGEILGGLRDPNRRLVSILGTGGIGKTRLATQIGWEALGEFEDGVFLISLAPLTQSQWMPELAQVLGLVEAAHGALWDQICAFLKTRRVLLIFDNFEHVLDAAPHIARLLAACPLLHVLTTSRAALEISGEHQFLLTPLASPLATESLQIIEAASAVQLFVRRARAAKRDFELDDENAGSIAEICTRLDGLPLAIELAATHIKAMEAPELLLRLEKRLDLLEKGPRDWPERHRSLRAAFSWNYDSLHEDARRLFRSLGPCVGGANLELASAVSELEPRQTENALQILVENSLLNRRGDENGAERFEMLQTLREFALEQLDHEKDNESGDKTAVWNRYATFFEAWTPQIAASMNGSGAPEVLRQLDVEWPNLRGALDWISPRRPEVALKIAVALEPYFEARSLFGEGCARLEILLETLGEAHFSDTPENQRFAGQALGIAGRFRFYLADFKRSLATFERAIALARQSDDKIGLASALSFGSLALIYHQRGEDGVMIERDPVEEKLREALDLMRELGSGQGEAMALINLGVLFNADGDHERGQAHYEQAIEIARAAEVPVALIMGLFFLGDSVGLTQQKPHEARPHFEIGQKLALEIGFPLGVAFHGWGIALCCLAEGDLAQAKMLLKEGGPMVARIGHGWGRAFWLEAVGHFYTTSGNWRAAAQFYGAARHLRTRLGVPLTRSYFPLFENYYAKAKSLCSPEEWNAAWESGRMLSFETALENFIA